MISSPWLAEMNIILHTTRAFFCIVLCIMYLQNVVCVCVCVCNIWTDVKLLWFEPFHFCRESFHICRGTWHTIRDHVQRSYLIVWDTEPDQLCVPAVRISGIARGQAKNPKDEHDTCARLSQSELHVGLHQNLPQSKDVESNFVTFCLHDRRHHRRRQFLIA